MNRWYLYTLLSITALIGLPLFSHAQPAIRVQPDVIEFEIDPGDDEIQTRSFTIFNDGNQLLRWAGRIVITNQPDIAGEPGELIGGFGGNNAANQLCSPVGWDRENEIMWIANADRQSIVGWRHDGRYENFEEARRINAGVYYDGAWANGVFYLPQFGAAILNRFNTAGQNLGAIMMPFPITGVAADVEEGRLFVMDSQQRAIHVFPLNDNGGIGGSIGTIDDHLEYHNNSVSYTLEWVPRHTDGQLWMIAPNNGRIYQIAVDTDNWTCTEEVQNFEVFPGGAAAATAAVCHDGYNIWAAGLAEDDIRIYDDGITEAYWLFIDPPEGDVEPGGAMEVDVVFDASELIGGEYAAEIQIVSNDPDHPLVIVGIRAFLLGDPDIEVEWPAECGYPDVMDFNMRYEDVFVGVWYTLPFTINNVGWSDLDLLDIQTEEEAFSVEFDQRVLGAGEDVHYELRFRATEPGVYEDVLAIVSSDPDEGELQIALHAEVVNPPVMTVNPVELDIAPDSFVVQVAIDISNDGESDLRWRAEIAMVDSARQAENATEVTIEPEEGVIGPQDEQQVILTFRLNDMERAFEEFDLHIYSNDPENPEQIIHITIHWPVEVVAEELLPATTRLISAYPNPFNGSTTISFGVGAYGKTPLRIAVFGVDGRKVADLFDKRGRLSYATGYHSVVWNAAGFPAGSYLIRLEAGGTVQEQWVRLVK